MSSAHYIIVARNTETGEIKLPLGDMTLYGMGVDGETGQYEEESVVATCALNFGPDWTLALYGQLGAGYVGRKTKRDRD